MSEKKESTITITKSTLWMTTTIVFALLFVLSLSLGWGANCDATGKTIDGTNNQPAAAAPTPTPTPTINVKKLSNDPIRGSEDAKITVFEFSDFQCPFCARANEGVVAGFEASEMYKNGEVNLLFRNFPLESIHPNARPAAIAGVCAKEQGKFWELHDKMFANQGSLSTENYKLWANELGLDMDEFNSCLTSSEANSKVSADLTSATTAGGRGTPYFVVLNTENGKTASVSGAVPYAQLEAAINSVK